MIPLPTVIAALPTIIDAITRGAALAQKFSEAIKAGKGNTEVSAEDWAELERLSGLTSAEIYKRMGVTPP